MKFYTMFFGMAVSLTLAIVCTAVLAETSKGPDGQREKPVEQSIGTHMTYLFKPSYRRLKAAMRAEPEDADAWDAIRSEALLLAEAGGRLTDREPEAGLNPDTTYWAKTSREVRKHGAGLYEAAKEKDFAAATRDYRAMTASCNACHRGSVALGAPPLLNPFGRGVTD